METAPDTELEVSHRWAFSEPTVFEHLAGKQVGRVYYMPGKILSIVTRVSG